MKQIFVLYSLFFLNCCVPGNLKANDVYVKKSPIIINPQSPTTVIYNENEISQKTISKIISGLSEETKSTSHNYENLALDQIQQGNFIQAKDYIEKAIKRNPKNSKVYLSRGLIYYFGGYSNSNKAYLHQALSDFNFYIENASSNKVILSTAYLFRGNTYSHLKYKNKKNLMLNNYKKACDLDISNCQSYYDFIEILEKDKYQEHKELAVKVFKHDLRKGLYHINEAIKLGTLPYDAYLIRGLIYMHWGEKLGNDDYILKSAHDFGWVIGATDNDLEFKSMGYRYSGDLDKYINDNRGALKNYEIACELDSSNCHTFYKFKDLLRLQNQ